MNSKNLVTEAVSDVGGSPERSKSFRITVCCEASDDDTMLVITREIQAGGKSISRINGRIINASILKNLAPFLVDMHLAKCPAQHP